MKHRDNRSNTMSIYHLLGTWHCCHLLVHVHLIFILDFIAFDFSPFSLCIEGCEPCVLRSSHAVIPRRSLNAPVDTYIIQQMQRYKIHEYFAFIAGLWCHIVEASKRSMQYVNLAGGAKLGMFNARKVTRSKYEQVSACSLQCLNTHRRYTYITNVRHVNYVLLDAISVRLIHWFAPVAIDIDQPSIGCGSSAFAAKKLPEERQALALCYAPKHVHVA
jgi:hypothetical protein